MTAKEAKALGYSVVKASPFEVGLLHKGKGVKTWFARDFGGKLPKLDHSIIRETVILHECLLAEMKS
jgi:hypothetical protein